MNKMMAIKILNLSNEMDVDEADVCMMWHMNERPTS